MRNPVPVALLLLLVTGAGVLAQEVPIDEITIDATGCAQIRVASTSAHYYVLYRRISLEDDSEQAVSLTLGRDGTTVLTEPLGAHGPPELYRVVQHRRDAPADTDADGIDDMEEFLDPGRLSPLNPAPEVRFRDGTVSIPDRETFRELSYQGLEVVVDAHLENLEFVKFYILESNTDNPQVYFMNTNTHRAHPSSASTSRSRRSRKRSRSSARDHIGCGDSSTA